jgi:Kelch motif
VGVHGARRRRYITGSSATAVVAFLFLLLPQASSAAGGWTTMAGSLATSRASFAATAGPCVRIVAAAQCLYAAGGFSSADANLASTEVAGLGTTSATWTTLPSPLNTGRGYDNGTWGPCPGTTGLTTARQCFYAIGGDNYTLPRIALSSVEYLDPTATTPHWTTMPTSLATSRAVFGATTAPCPGTSGYATANQCLYVIGGYDANDNVGYLNSVELFDPSNPSLGWRTMSNGLGTARSALAATTAPCPGSSGLAGARECVYAIGGYNAGIGYLSTIEYMNPSAATPTWTRASATLNTPRSTHRAATAPCPATSGLATARLCLYVAGGALGSYLASVEYADPSTSSLTWTSMAQALNTARGSLGVTSAACPTTGALDSQSVCLYALGGASSDPSANFLGSTEFFNPAAAVSAGTALAVSQPKGFPGALRALTGHGFTAAEQVKVYWNGLGGPPVATTVADAAGSVGAGTALTFRVPTAPAGRYGLFAVGQTSGRTGYAVLDVVPALRISPTSGSAGSSAVVSGKGYGAQEQVTVRWDCAAERSQCTGLVLGTGQTDETGTFSVPVTIPRDAAPATFQIGGKGVTTKLYADLDFTVTP